MGWPLERVEFLSPGPNGKTGTISVSGKENLIAIAQGEARVWDVMEIEVEFEKVSLETQDTYDDQQVTLPSNVFKSSDAYKHEGEWVNIQIDRAYCSNQIRY